MRINVIGGGPAGLYFALLMRRRWPAHRVTVYERDAPGSTFGWGVVFSGKTLSNLRAADEESHRSITESFETWDRVVVVKADGRVEVGGNHFSGIARLRLLDILRRRCAGLGVGLRFNDEVSDVDALLDADLVVGADGVGSRVRERFAGHFRPRLARGANKYVWYGTRQPFRGLTLTFRESEAGLFAAHSYKFDRETSTFIVECGEETWARAGLGERTDREAREYLAGVFRDDLGGHEFLSNNSRWINFLLVRNERWSYKHVVLLGDALHTAHFSIGSGTKLAIEDAIALFECFDAGAGVPEALARFQQARQPVIEEYQQAADESRVWFERAADYVRLPPLQFAYSLMTRSGKVTRESLRRRDPGFVAALEAASGPAADDGGA